MATPFSLVSIISRLMRMWKIEEFLLSVGAWKIIIFNFVLFYKNIFFSNL